jgi:hypothetical protein
MSKTKLVAVDLAKHCYQVGAIDERGRLLYNRKLSRSSSRLCAVRPRTFNARDTSEAPATGAPHSTLLDCFADESCD